MIINEIKEKIGDILDEIQINSAIELIKEKEINELIPYYLGFKGDIYKNEKGIYNSKGVYKWINNSTIEITELPIGTWTENYKEFLERISFYYTNVFKNNTNVLKMNTFVLE